MRIFYAPDDGEKQEWSYKPDRLMATEAEAIENVTGMRYAEFAGKFLVGNATASRALVWVLRKRHGEPTLRFKDVDFPVGALRVELDDEENERVRQARLNDPTLTEEERAELAAEMGEVPKDEAPSSSAAGG